MSGLREYLEKRRDETRKKMEPVAVAAAELRTQLSAQDAQLRALAKELSDIEKALQALGKKEKLETHAHHQGGHPPSSQWSAKRHGFARHTGGD